MSRAVVTVVRTVAAMPLVWAWFAAVFPWLMGQKSDLGLAAAIAGSVLVPAVAIWASGIPGVLIRMLRSRQARRDLEVADRLDDLIRDSDAESPEQWLERHRQLSQDKGRRE